jgi:hypothetical protein
MMGDLKAALKSSAVHPVYVLTYSEFGNISLPYFRAGGSAVVA